MAVTIKKMTLWRNEVANQPGVLANTLGPLAEAGVDLQVLIAYRYAGDPGKAAIEVYPISGKKAASAAQQAGLSAFSLPALLVEGNNKPGLGYKIAQALAGAGINLAFAVAQVVGRRYSAVFGFENDADARKARNLIRRATEPRRAAPKRSRAK